MLSRTVIKRLNQEEKNFVKEGAFAVTVLTGAFSYYHYRQYLKKDFYRSEAHYRFNSQITNITPWK